MDAQPQTQTQAETTTPTSVDYATAPLAAVKADVLRDGVIDDREVTALRSRIFADGVVDREEADLLFDLNDAVSGKEGTSPRFGHLFVEGVCAHVLEDAQTPGTVDEQEGAYVVSRIEGDGQVDTNEKALLVTLWARGTTLPASLQTLINKHING